MNTRTTCINVLALCLLAAGCAYPKRVAPSTATVTKAIELKENQTVTSGRRVVVLRAGRYEPEFQADDGVYYKAPPLGMEQIEPKPWPLMVPPNRFLHGGLFIADAGAKDKRDAIYLYYERPLFGTIVEMRPLEMHHLREKVIHEEAPAQTASH